MVLAHLGCPDISLAGFPADHPKNFCKLLVWHFFTGQMAFLVMHPTVSNHWMLAIT